MFGTRRALRADRLHRRSISSQARSDRTTALLFIALINRVLGQFSEQERNFGDDLSAARETAFAKIRSRVEGTLLAADQLG